MIIFKNITLIKNMSNQIPPPKNNKNVDEIYKVMDHRNHIFKKPDTYVGSCEPEINEYYIYDEENKKIVLKEISCPPGWYKCFDELIVNAHDHKKRTEKLIKDNPEDNHKQVNNIKVSILEDNSIEFYNDGDGIHIEYLEKDKMYPVELIFGTLLSSTNFDDNEKREWGGRNGYGAGT